MRRSIRVGSRGHGCLANWPWHNLIANQGNKTATSPWPGPNTYLTSTVYWCIASKLKVPLFFFFYGMNKTFCGWICHFSISLTLAVLQRQKSLPDIGGTTIQDVGHLAVMRTAMGPGVHTMSDKYSLLMHCIKIKSPVKFLLNEQYVFVGGNISFLCVLSCSSEEA